MEIKAGFFHGSCHDMLETETFSVFPRLKRRRFIQIQANTIIGLLLNCYWAVTWLNSYWTVTWLNCYWTFTLLNCYLTELTWLICHWTVTELLLDWALTLLNCYWTVTWLSCYFTEFFACLNLRNSEVSHLNFLWLVGIYIIKNSRRQGLYTDTALHDMNLIYTYWRYPSPTLPVRW